MKKILVVEDDTGISMVLKAYLAKAGYEVEQAFDGEQAMEKFVQRNPSLVLLDVMLPGRDGWSILKQIRERSACPVIMLTALGDIPYRLEGLRGGADDYLVKPFIGEEVVARVQAVLRRQLQVVTEDMAIFGSLRINYASREVYLNGQPVRLTPRDLSLLLFLAIHPNQSFEREQLIRCVWGADYGGSDRAVDLAVKRIRQSLAAWPKHEGELVTLRGWGYKFHVRTKS
ncbi:DNA-binding response regulator [Xylanibacillus composti]|uniref:DNA-binding response regulator n=1 Tax=Xylanibacillus composti TaxID=1572762 RepID=A0A8J4H0J8_9BACL|nr:response regulator transcription factor [Xylanibacillus composti]MDT9723891.1 DNA-binding response regulator [Xylanibacillus composti]GIQ67330.1 DNA-binding response regulator [Xylanibacillus composti]